jgi:hypothetical protein
MTRNARQLIGAIAALAFVALYIVVAVAVADLLPDNRAVQLIYFVIVGIGWGVPLVPLLSWMENGKFEFRKRLREEP